jgi:hypothetical protein
MQKIGPAGSIRVFKTHQSLGAQNHSPTRRTFQISARVDDAWPSWLMRYLAFTQILPSWYTSGQRITSIYCAHIQNGQIT